MTRKKLIIANIILFAIMLFIIILEDYPSKIYNIFNPSSNYNYEKQPSYIRQVDLYTSYHKEGTIVMLGNSITFGVNWNELLNRTDIVNRGISGDITQGMLNRLEFVLNSNPKMCFIMGGINDINRGISPEDIVQNLNEITLKLEEHSIIPVLFSVLYVSESFPFSSSINKKVAQTNMLIQELCNDKSILFINLNESLSKEGLLIEDYTYDGIHLNAKGYSKWETILSPVIEEILLSN